MYEMNTKIITLGKFSFLAGVHFKVSRVSPLNNWKDVHLKTKTWPGFGIIFAKFND